MIVLSALDKPDAKLRVFRLGAVGRITKPVERRRFGRGWLAISSGIVSVKTSKHTYGRSASKPRRMIAVTKERQHFDDFSCRP